MIANFQARNHNLNNSTKITASEDMVTRMVGRQRRTAVFLGVAIKFFKKKF